MIASDNQKSGFTLIELVVVIAILGTISGMLFFNFRSSSTNRTARNQVVSIVISSVRRAQTMASSGSQFQGAQACGFGVHYLTPSSLRIYAGSEANCSTANRNYQSATDGIVEDITLSNPNINIKTVFDDIFFEPPDPKTYINNNPSSAGQTIISIGATAQSCGGGNCTDIVIKAPGAINTNEN